MENIDDIDFEKLKVETKNKPNEACSVLYEKQYALKTHFESAY